MNEHRAHGSDARGCTTVHLHGEGGVATDESGVEVRLGPRETRLIREFVAAAPPRELCELSAAGEASLCEAGRLEPLDAVSAQVGPMPRHWLADIPGRVVNRPDATNANSSFLRQLLSERESVLVDGPLDADRLWELIEYLRQIRDIKSDAAGRVWTRRGVPSAGGTHSIDLLVAVRNVRTLEPGWYRWSDESARPMALAVPAAEALIGDARAALRGNRHVAAFVFAICDFAVLASRYPTGSSLAWRDAGALLGLAQLMSTGLGMSSTIVGSVTEMSGITVPRQGAPVWSLGALALGGYRQDPRTSALVAGTVAARPPKDAR
jgi:hypothetical protein